MSITSKSVKQRHDQPTRKVIRVEIIENYSSLKAGIVVEMHPVLYKQLLDKGVCVKTTKPLGYTQQVKKETKPVVDETSGDETGASASVEGGSK